MNSLILATEAVTHQTYSYLLAATARLRRHDELALDDDGLAVRDRGAVSLEQVLWFVAAGVSVAAIATILWTTIRDEAEDPANNDRPVSP